MKYLSRLLFAAVASAAFFIAFAQAQNAGTVTQHAFAIGKGPGVGGYTSLLCGSAQLAVGQAAADPICQTITGDVTLSAAGVTAVGNIPSGVTVAGSLLWTAIAAPTTPAAGKENVWVDSTDNRFHDKNSAGTIGTTAVASTCSTSNWFRTMSSAGAFGCSQPSFTDLTGSLSCTQHPALTGDVTNSAGSCATTIAANAITNAKMATMNAWTFKANMTSGSATPTDITIDGQTLKASPASTDEVLIWDVAGAAVKKTTVSALSSAGSVGSLNTKTGALTLAMTQQKFTASGTYTPSAGLLFAIIECQGAGGGGGGAAGTAGDNFAAAGGGSGSYSRKYASAATIGVSQTVTIGATGNGGAAGANSGSAGGDTSVGTLCIGKGGSGGSFVSSGNSNVAGGAGGVAGTGDLTVPGNAGQSGMFAAITTVVIGVGMGGASYFGGAPALPAVTNAVANAGISAAANSGAGGSGANATNVAANSAGGNGGSGLVFITEFTLN